MTEELCNLIFKGQIIEGKNSDEVIECLSKTLKVDKKVIEDIFRRAPVAIKKKVSYRVAHKFIKQFGACSALLIIEDVIETSDTKIVKLEHKKDGENKTSTEMDNVNIQKNNIIEECGKNITSKNRSDLEFYEKKLLGEFATRIRAGDCSRNLIVEMFSFGDEKIEKIVKRRGGTLEDLRLKRKEAAKRLFEDYPASRANYYLEVLEQGIPLNYNINNTAQERVQNKVEQKYKIICPSCGKRLSANIFTSQKKGYLIYVCPYCNEQLAIYEGQAIVDPAKAYLAEVIPMVDNRLSYGDRKDVAYHNPRERVEQGILYGKVAKEAEKIRQNHLGAKPVGSNEEVGCGQIFVWLLIFGAILAILPRACGY